MVATYKYDANGRRVEKAVSGGVTERYVYSGLETVAVYDGSNARQREFVFGQGIDEVLMMEQADVLDFDADSNTSELTRSFYHRNALGSVMEITDMNQVTVESMRYTPYGQVTITRGGSTQSSDPLGQHWAYTGRFLDEDTGLCYCRSRYFDAARGRFLQRDPLGVVTGPNPFTYCDGSPSNLVDPLGLEDFVAPPPVIPGIPANVKPMFESDSHSWTGFQQYTWTWTAEDKQTWSEYCKVVITPSDEQLLAGERCNNCCEEFHVTETTTTKFTVVARRQRGQRGADVDPLDPASDEHAFQVWWLAAAVEGGDYNPNPLDHLAHFQAHFIRDRMAKAHGGSLPAPFHYALGGWFITVSRRVHKEKTASPGKVECPCQHQAASDCSSLRALVPKAK